VQYSRGCPFTCEFCDIIELYGRVPRTKTTTKFWFELQALYDHGYRGHVDFVAIFHLATRRISAPFCTGLKHVGRTRLSVRVSTEASVNIADDEKNSHPSSLQ